MPANVEVSIPVEKQGTGFRGEKERDTRQHTVILEGDKVTLARTGVSSERVSFQLSDLTEAVSFLKSRAVDAHRPAPFGR